MKKLKFLKSFIFSAIILSFLFITALLNIALILSPTKNLVSGETNFSGYISEVKTAYTSNFNGKDSYVNLNGLFARITGRKVYNETALLKNGMLINSEIVELDMKSAAEGLTEFSNYLKDSGRQYLYVQAPYKMDMDNSLLPEGVVNYANDNSDELIGYLKAANVPVLDLRPHIAADVEMVEKNFFRTDHHWKPEGAFEAFKQITTYLGVETDYTNINRWKSHTLNDWFLGSLGKRVGINYAGTDDFVYLTPDFDTEISKYVTNHKTFYKGDFIDANMDLSYLDGKDYFGDNVYCMYIGGDYPLVKHRNSKAVSNTKVLLIKDSFSLPVQAFLTSVFAEVDVVDPRYFKECNIAEYIELSDPGVVISLTNPSVFRANEYWSYDVKKAQSLADKKERTDVIKKQDVTISAGDSAHNYVTLAKGLEYGTQYTFTAEDIKILSGESNGATVVLYNNDSKTILSSHAFDIEYCRKKGEFSWSLLTPESGDGELSLLIYSGLHGHTQNIETLWQGAELKMHK